MLKFKDTLLTVNKYFALNILNKALISVIKVFTDINIKTFNNRLKSNESK